MNDQPRHIPPTAPTAAFALIYAVTLVLIPGGDFEEAMNGLLPRGFLNGLTLNPVQYQYQIWAHGPLVLGLALTPLYALTDSLMLWIKLLGFGFAVLGFWSWNRLARSMDRRGAWMFAALWLAPAPFAFHQLHTVWANHMESMALIGALLWLAARDAEGKGSAAGVFALGLATAGAGLFCSQAWLAVPSILWILVFGARRAKAAVAGRVAALFVGLAPAPLVQFVFIGAYLPTAPEASSWAMPWKWGEALFLSRPSLAPAPPALSKLVALLGDIAPVFLGYATPILSALLPMLAVAGAAVVFGARLGRLKRATIPASTVDAAVALFAVVWLVAYAFGSFSIDDPRSAYDQRYLIVLVPVIWWFAARVASLTRWGWIVVAVFVFAGAASLTVKWSEAWRAPFTRAFPIGLVAQRGDNMMYFSEIHWRKFAWAGGGVGGSVCDQALSEIDRAPALGRPWSELVLRSVGQGFDAARAACVDPLNPRAWGLVFGRGRAAAEPTPETRCDPGNVRAALESAASLDPAAASAYRQGAGFAWAECRDRGFRETVFGPMIDPASEAARDVATGLGRRVAAYAGECDGIRIDGAIAENLIDTDILDPSLIPAAREGLLDDLIFSVASRCRYLHARSIAPDDRRALAERWRGRGVVLDPRGDDILRVRVADWGE